MKMKLIKISIFFIVLIKGSWSYIEPGEVNPQSQKQFLNQFKLIYDNRKSATRIANGFAAKFGEVNEFCYLSNNFFNKRQNCGCVIVDNCHVLTSASCVKEYVIILYVK